MKHDQDESADKYKLLGPVDDVIDEFGGVATNCSAHRLNVVFINGRCIVARLVSHSDPQTLAINGEIAAVTMVATPAINATATGIASNRFMGIEIGDAR